MTPVFEAFLRLQHILRDRAGRLLGPWRNQTQATSADASDDKTIPGSVDLVNLLATLFFGRLGELAMLSLAINLLSLAVPVFVLQVYDRVIFHGGLVTLAGLILGVLLAIGFDFLLRQARSRLVQMIGVRVDASLVKSLVAHLLRLPLSSLEKRSIAQWQTLFNDHEMVRDTVSSSLPLLFVDLPFIFVFLGAIWLVAPPIAGLLLLIIPVYVGFAALSSWAVTRAARDEQDKAPARNALTTELIAGRLAVKSIGIGTALSDRWGGAHATLVERSIVRGAHSDTFQNLSVALGMATTILITSYGAMAIVDQQMTIGGLIAANMLASRIVQPLTQMIGAWRTISRLRAALRRLEDVLKLPVDAMKSTVSRNQPQGLLMLENVSFRYEDGAAAVLNDLSIVVGSGGMHGLVGRNGSGKSTLLKIMQGLYTPQNGRVLLDNADMAQFGREELSRWIGYVPQEPFLLAGSIRDNITGFAAGIDDAAILTAAKRAGADAFIDALPDGYGVDVGEGGRYLSSGQRQQIALARALLYEPSLLLLDEPSANLDEEASRRLISQLRWMAKSCTIIAVSHSTQLLRACDMVLTLDNGSIACTRRGRVTRTSSGVPPEGSQAA